MNLAPPIATSLRVGGCLAGLSVVGWLSVLLLPPVSEAEFSELAALRHEEVARRQVGEFALWNHQPEILAARQIGPFGHRAVSLLVLATFPAVLAAKRQVLPDICSGLPLLKQESWQAFYRVLAYSAIMWFTLGILVARAVGGVRHVLGRRSTVTLGAG
jgi:hypothetical protein